MTPGEILIALCFVNVSVIFHLKYVLNHIAPIPVEMGQLSHDSISIWLWDWEFLKI